MKCLYLLFLTIVFRLYLDNHPTILLETIEFFVVFHMRAYLQKFYQYYPLVKTDETSMDSEDSFIEKLYAIFKMNITDERKL